MKFGTFSFSVFPAQIAMPMRQVRTAVEQVLPEVAGRGIRRYASGALGERAALHNSDREGIMGEDASNVTIVVSVQGKEVGEGKHSTSIDKRLGRLHDGCGQELELFQLDCMQRHRLE